MAENIKRPARARMWKNIAIVGAIVSAGVLAVFTLVSFLPKGDEAFSVRIDRPSNADHYHMALSKDALDDSVTYVRAEQIDSMELTDADTVERFLASQGELSASNYYQTYNDNNEIDKSYALVYTVYLVNDSTSETQEVLYSVDVDGYNSPSNTSYEPFDYFRVLIQTEQMNSSEPKNNKYFGKHHTWYSNRLNDKGDNREAISGVTNILQGEDTVLSSLFNSSGNDGYCTDFNDLSITKHIINGESVKIPAGQVLRFTFVAYFEGNDLDAQGNPPKDSYLLLSLHFGV